MSGIAQAGLVFFVLFVLMFLSVGNTGNKGKGPRIRDEDAETWWDARNSWWDDRR